MDNDIFGTALELEQSHLKDGFQEGFDEGLKIGEVEGYEVGMKTGFEVGEELGFYSGCTLIWTELMQKDEGAFSARAKRAIVQVRELIREYPVLNHDNENLQEKFQLIRSKFKALTSMLGIKLEYQGLPTSNSGRQDQTF